MWKEIALILVGFVLGGISFTYLTLSILKEMVGDDYEINKPKVKGENNLLQILQSNNKEEKEESSDKEDKKKRLFKRKNK